MSKGIKKKSLKLCCQNSEEGNKDPWASQVALAINNSPANAGDKRDTSSTLGLGRSPGVGNSNPLQYSCLENSVNRGA